MSDSPLPGDSFTEFLTAYGEMRSPSLQYSDGDNFAVWQRRFRKQLEAWRSPVPDRVPPEAEVLATAEEEDHVRHLLRIPVTAISSVPAYLLVPRGLQEGEQRAGLVAIHGHYRHGIDSIAGVVLEEDDPNNDLPHAYALHAVRAGYVVVVPALWGWPGRDGHLDKVGARDRCNTIQMAAAMYGINLVDLHVQDCQAALDVLAARPEVDATRLGCLGNSTGGRMTMWLTIWDERIAACVPSGCMNTFRERSQKLSSCGIQFPFGLLRLGDVPELFSLIAPRPMQLQAGEGDALITPTDRDEMEAAVRLAYVRLEAEGSFDYALHQEGHLLEWELAAPFLDNHLGN
ncbi:dienelactone hydrolase family protein [Candidatus Latescibacterota bacterium]